MSSDCDNNDFTGNRNDDGGTGDEDDGSQGTVSVIEIIGTCSDEGGNCARAFAVSPGAIFGITAAN